MYLQIIKKIKKFNLFLIYLVPSKPTSPGTSPTVMAHPLALSLPPRGKKKSYDPFSPYIITLPKFIYSILLAFYFILEFSFYLYPFL